VRALCMAPLLTDPADALCTDPAKQVTLPPTYIALDTERYHLKAERDFFAAEGSEFGGDDASLGAERVRNQSLLHMAKVLERLHDCPCAVLPITLRHAGSRAQQGLVFPRLQGYSMGLTGDLAFNARLVDAIAAALAAIHARGVVHMDFYLSNVMWRVAADGTVDVRVIDWDVARLEGETLPKAILDRLKRSPRYRLHRRDEAVCAYDTFFIDAIRHALEDGSWRSLDARDKGELDGAFRDLCEAYGEAMDAGGEGCSCAGEEEGAG
jgi:hypothetical protein